MFTQGFVSEHTILAPVTVRCPSNGRSASSTSGLLAPAAQSSVGRAACSCLPWPAVLPRKPHRPHTTPTAGQAIPLRTHTPCYSAATAASHRSRTSEPSYSSSRGHPLLRLPRLRVVPFLGLAVVHCRGAPRGMVNVVKERLPSKEYCTWRG